MSLADVELADGYTPCTRCGERPTYNEPWNTIHCGTTFQFRVCFNCVLRFDDRCQAVDE